MSPDGEMDRIGPNVYALGNGDPTGNASEHNAMKTQYGAGIGSGSALSGSWSFQFFVHNEDGLNLSVDLNSDPLDWMRACSSGIIVPQHIHMSNSMPIEEGSTRRSKVADSHNSERTLVDGSYKRSLSKRAGISRIDESSNGYIGKEVLAGLQMVPDGSKSTVELNKRRVVYEGTCILEPGILNDSGQEPGYQQCIQAHEAMQKENGEISRNLHGNGPLENSLEEMSDSKPTKDFQNSERHKIEVKKTQKTNLRTLKTLARGPIGLSDDDAKERRRRRKSSRFTVKDLL